MKWLIPGVLFLIAVSALPARAQDGGGRYILATGAGNRALAMGGAYTAIADDASAPLWNPGGLGLIPRPQFQATRTSYYGLEMNEEYLGLAIPNWRWGTLAATFRHFGAQGINGRDDRNFLTDSFSNDETQFTLSYGKQWADTWSVGGTLKLLSQSLSEGSASGVGIDVGAIAFPGLIFAYDRPWAHRFSVGLAVNNLVEPSLQLDEESVSDPIATRLGLAYRHPLGGPGRHLIAALDFENSSQTDPNVFAGLEFAFIPAMAIRAGLGGGVPTVGTRVQWRDFSVDYVYESNRLDNLHRFGVSVGFGSTVEESRMAGLLREQEELDARLNLAFSERQEKQASLLVENAEMAFASGGHEEALEILAVVSVLTPDDDVVPQLRIQFLLEKAEEAEQDSAFAKAAVIFGEVLALDPDNLEAAGGSERCLAESNRLAERSAWFQGRFAEGLDAFSIGDLLSARRIFMEILETKPTDVEASEMLVRTDAAIERRTAELEIQAQRFIKAGLLPEAETTLAEATRLMPDSHSVNTTRIALSRAQQEVRRARAALEPDPNTPEAPPRPELTPEQRKEVETFYENGVAAIKEGRIQDAIGYWEWVYSMDPDYRRVKEYLKREHHLLGIQAFSEGSLTEAIGFWETALSIDPEDAKTTIYLERARQHLERSREISGTIAQ